MSALWNIYFVKYSFYDILWNIYFKKQVTLWIGDLIAHTSALWNFRWLDQKGILAQPPVKFHPKYKYKFKKVQMQVEIQLQIQIHNRNLPNWNNFCTGFHKVPLAVPKLHKKIYLYIDIENIKILRKHRFNIWHMEC